MPRAMADVIARWAGRRDEWSRLKVQVDGAALAAEIIGDLEAIAQSEADAALSLPDAAEESG